MESTFKEGVEQERKHRLLAECALTESRAALEALQIELNQNRQRFSESRDAHLLPKVAVKLSTVYMHDLQVQMICPYFLSMELQLATLQPIVGENYLDSFSLLLHFCQTEKARCYAFLFYFCK